MKLHKYRDFIFESMLNESILVYSEKFKSLVSKIDSPVSKALLDAESKDYELANNYIDLGDNKDQITFIQDRRAKDILKPENAEKYCFITGNGYLTHSDRNSEIFDMLEYQM